MSTEANKAAVRRIGDELWTGRNRAVVHEVFATTIRDNELGDSLTPGKLEAYFEHFHMQYPDLIVTRQDVFGEGDWVTQYLEAEGTHSAPVYGLEATGKRVVIRELNLFRFEDGRIVERIGYDNALASFRTFGRIPPGVYDLLGIPRP